MDRVETEVQKKLVIFCKYVREHVEKWKPILQESTKTVESLCNQAEQLRHVEKANIADMPDFEKTQNILLARISDGIECEISSTKKIIEKLNKANQDLKNKLTSLENATCDLNWEREGPLIKGSPTQPRLAMILSEALEFWLFFKNALQKVNECFKAIDPRDAKSMRAFENAFKIDVEGDRIVNFLALIQYVGDDIL